jgi:hypothetical protein
VALTYIKSKTINTPFRVANTVRDIWNYRNA